MEIGVGPQASQSHVFLIFWNKIELIHRNLSPRGLSPFMLMGHQSFLSPFLTLSPLNLVVKGNEELTERSEKEEADSLHVTVSQHNPRRNSKHIVCHHT